LLYSSRFSDKFLSKALTSSIVLSGRERCIFDTSNIGGSPDVVRLIFFSTATERVFNSLICCERVVIVLYIFSKWAEKLIILREQYEKRK